MGTGTENNLLEEARERIDAALARLQSNANTATEKMGLATASAADVETNDGLIAEKDARIEALEGENLRLHEQIATLSLQQDVPSVDAGDKDYSALEAEKNALQQNYDLLKRQYTSLQDEMEGMETDSMPSSGEAPADDKELSIMKATVESLTEERDMIRNELDNAINELESFLSSNQTAAGGH